MTGNATGADGTADRAGRTADFEDGLARFGVEALGLGRGDGLGELATISTLRWRFNLFSARFGLSGRSKPPRRSRSVFPRRRFGCATIPVAAGCGSRAIVEELRAAAKEEADETEDEEDRLVDRRPFAGFRLGLRAMDIGRRLGIL